MVQMVVSMPGDVEEWGLVELQGQLETREQVPLDSMNIGDLHFNNRGIPNLIIGHHLLTGKVITLEKPYAILKKKRQRAGTSSGIGMELESGLELESGMESKDLNDDIRTEYEVVALITKKIIFKNRPKPIVTKTAMIKR